MSESTTRPFRLEDFCARCGEDLRYHNTAYMTIGLWCASAHRFGEYHSGNPRRIQSEWFSEWVRAQRYAEKRYRCFREAYQREFGTKNEELEPA